MEKKAKQDPTVEDRGTKLVAAIADGLRAQREYIAKRLKEGSDFSLMVADAFVRGIRDLGYKSNGTALDELIDNALQATARNIHLAFGYVNTTADKPNALAVIDDGHGMDAEMVRASVMWGGTHRENDRKGFGRFGYGLPSACVSMGMRFTVFSWTSKGAVNSVSFDIDDLSQGKYRGADGKISVPATVVAPLPDWVIKYCETHFAGGVPDSGTVVVIDKLDRLKWKTTKTLEEKLSEHLGQVYRNYLRQVTIGVNGSVVQPIDPLFLTSGAKYYKGDAEGLPELQFAVKDKDTGKPAGMVKVRYSFLPPRCFSDRYAPEEMKSLVKARQAIMKDNLGMVVLRQGRQIDVVRFPREWNLVPLNNDRFWKIELDFPPALDEEFAVTTSKQQVGISDRIWEMLREQGVRTVGKDMRTRAHKELDELKHERDEGKREGPRASEQAMEDSAKLRIQRPSGESAKRKQDAEVALDEFVARKASLAGVAPEVIKREAEAEQKERPYKVERESHPGAPFFRVLQRGGQVVLLINEAHRFYTDVYASFEATPHIRAGLEVLLFSIGVSELDAGDDRKRFYESERNEWSRILNAVLASLRDIDADHTDTHSDDGEAEGHAAA